MKKRMLSLAIAFIMILALAPGAPPAAGAAPASSLEALFALVSYVGDVSKCRMTERQAQAYIEVLRDAERERESEEARADAWGIPGLYSLADIVQYAILIDVGGDGIPLLLLANQWYYDYNSEYGKAETGGSRSIWQYDGSNTVGFGVFGSDMHCSYNDNVILFYGADSGGGSWENHIAVYSVIDGMIEIRNTAGLHGAAWSPEIGIIVDGIRRFDIGASNFKASVLTEWGLASLIECVSQRDNEYLHWDEQTPTCDLCFSIGGYWSGVPFSTPYSGRIGGSAFKTTSQPDNMITALGNYIEWLEAAVPRYPFPEVELAGERLRAADAALAGLLGGGETVFFRLAADLYYAVGVRDGRAAGGAVIREGRRDGGFVFYAEHSGDALLSVGELAGYISRAAAAPNVEIDFGAVSRFTRAGEFIEYLRDAIDNTDGSAPNDAALRVIAAYIQEAVGRSSMRAVDAVGNVLAPGAGDIARAAASAQECYDGFMQMLPEYNITLPRPVAVNARIAGRDIDFGGAVKLTLDGSAAEALGDVGVTFYLGGVQHAVAFSGGDLRAVTGEHSAITAQIERRGGAYSITFIDGSGSIISRLPAPVTVTLPAGGQFDTVFADFGGREENWGGRHDEAARTLLFSTPFSGTYEVGGNLQDMADISDLPEEMQLAVRYMVSKGFFQPAGGLFDPRGAVSRYEFAETLVRMSFALDRSLTTSFEDVPRDSAYYPFIASGEHEGLIGGVGGNRFAGEDNMARQQAVALASRALHNRGGFMYPEDAEAYLLPYGDARDIAGWARGDVSLAAREGIVGMGGNFAPGRDITRAEAAIILYRLFAVLYETPPVAASMEFAAGDINDVDEENDDNAEVGGDGPQAGAGERAGSGDAGMAEQVSRSMLLVIGIIAVVIALGGAAAYFLYFKKRRKPIDPGDYCISESPELPLYPMKNSTPGAQPYPMDSGMPGAQPYPTDSSTPGAQPYPMDSGVPGLYPYPTDSGSPEALPHNSEIPAGIVCGNCGAALAGAARFCNKCGAAVSGVGESKPGEAR